MTNSVETSGTRRTAMSMIGLVNSPGTAVEPMCSIASAPSPSASPIGPMRLAAAMDQAASATARRTTSLGNPRPSAASSSGPTLQLFQTVPRRGAPDDRLGKAPSFTRTSRTWHRDRATAPKVGGTDGQVWRRVGNGSGGWKRVRVRDRRRILTP
jgi:uncharacterized protein with LGFP repeats